MILGMLIGTFIVVSSQSWAGAWLGMELNLMCFVPLIMKEEISKKVSMFYYVVQSVGSLFMLGAGMMVDSLPIMIIVIVFSMITKLGAIPIHFWVPSIVSNLNKVGVYTILSWQKVAPFSIISVLIMSISAISIMNIWVGAMFMMIMASPVMVVIFSGMVQMGWIFSLSSYLMWWYMLMYFILLMPIVMFMNMSSKNFALAIVNSGGLPPFTGFCIKLTAVMTLASKLGMTMIMGSGVALVSYTRMMISTMYEKTKVSLVVIFTMAVGMV